MSKKKAKHQKITLDQGVPPLIQEFHQKLKKLLDEYQLDLTAIPAYQIKITPRIQQ